MGPKSDHWTVAPSGYCPGIAALRPRGGRHSNRGPETGELLRLTSTTRSSMPIHDPIMRLFSRAGVDSAPASPGVYVLYDGPE